MSGVLNSLAVSLRTSTPYARLQKEVITRVGVIVGAIWPSRMGASRHWRSRGPDDSSRESGESSREPSNRYLATDDTLPQKIISSCTLKTIWESILLWAAPKKRTSHSKKRMRMAHKYLKPKHHYQICQVCGNLKLQHMLCGHCFRETMKRTAEYRRQKQEELKLQETAMQDCPESSHAHTLASSKL